jgi:hypothetical protein
MHVSAKDDSSSLLEITDKQVEVFPGTNEVGVETVDLARLGECVSVTQIESPALLKLDVQGYELSALQGCEDVLPRFDWVYVECSFVELYSGQAVADDVIVWLRQRGYGLAGVYNMAYDRGGAPIQADFMFERTDRG